MTTHRSAELPTSNSLSDNFPLAPEGVEAAYTQYWTKTHATEDDIRSTKESLASTNGYISDFCGDQVPPEVYTAAMISPIVNKVREPLYTMDARRSLLSFEDSYLQRTSSESLDYVYGLATDQTQLAQFWSIWTPELYENQPDLSNFLLTSEEDAPVPSRYWKNRKLGMKALGILELRKQYGVNIESFLTSGAMSADALFSHKANNNVATLQETLRARHLWSPYLEFMGYDGLSMLLQSRANEIQFLNQHNTGPINQAYDILYSMGDPATVEWRVNNMLSKSFGNLDHENVLGNTMSHGIMIGEARTADNTRIVWRRKSLGSIARKIDTHDTESLPMDIIAATVIKDTPEEIGDTLRKLIEKMKQPGPATLTPSPTRDKAVHIQGSDQYIDSVIHMMGYSDRDEIANIATTRNSSYHVAKVTFKFQEYGEPLPLHVEIQFNTREGRRQARIGGAAHAAYKLTGVSGGDIPDDFLTHIEELFDDKHHIGDLNLRPQSRTRSEELRRMTERVKS